MTSRENPREPVSPVPPYQHGHGPQDRVSSHDGAPIEGVVLGGTGSAGSRHGRRPGDPRIGFGRVSFGGPIFAPGSPYGPGSAPLTAGQGAAAIPRKSLVLAGALAALLPPLGVFYGTILGAMALIVLILPVGLIAGTDGLVFLWLLGIFWAVYGAHATNRRRREFARHLGLIP